MSTCVTKVLCEDSYWSIIWNRLPEDSEGFSPRINTGDDCWCPGQLETGPWETKKQVTPDTTWGHFVISILIRKSPSNLSAKGRLISDRHLIQLARSTLNWFVYLCGLREYHHHFETTLIEKACGYCYPGVASTHLYMHYDITLYPIINTASMFVCIS
jgi:hypothetical protein